MRIAFTNPESVTLVGGGEVSAATLARALARAPILVAVDGGADKALALGYWPELAVGDFDSISAQARAALGTARLRHVADQHDTDFDKALAAVTAPYVLAVGFSGARLDHTLAALNTLAANPGRRIVLDTGHDLCLLCPPRLELDLPTQARVSLFPLAPVRCAARGLVWPTDGLVFSPEARIGTSNAATGGAVVLEPEAPALLLMLPVDTLDTLLAALMPAPTWPATARAR